MTVSSKTKEIKHQGAAGEERSAPGASTAAGKALGRLTKFADIAQQVVCPETGVITSFERVSYKDGVCSFREIYDQDAADLERWILKSAARKLLMKIETRTKRVRVQYSEFVYFTDLESRKIKTVCARVRYYVEDAYIGKPSGGVVLEECRKPRFRVINCCRDKIGHQAQPEIWHAAKTDRCSYHNVAVCGSVWTCPICSRRINLKRQAHIAGAYNLFVMDKPELSPGVRDGDAVMVTMTIKHGAGDDLSDLLEKLKLADRKFLQKSYAYQKLVGYSRTVGGVKVKTASNLAYIGRVTATEITYGANGWHPHIHQLWFFDRRLTDLEIVELRKSLFAEWALACVAVGLPEPVEYVNRRPVGVDARRALSAEEYLTKFGDARQWAVEKEMAGQHVKTSRKGRSPFQLLSEYAGGDNKAGKLFAVFAESTLGRHQLEFSKSLRARLVELGLDEILASDEELAMQNEEDARRLGALTDDDFQALLDCERVTPGLEAFGTLLVLCKKHGFDEAINWLRSLPSYRSKVRLERLNSDEAKYIKVAQKSEAEFWSLINRVGGVPVLESEAESLRYEFDAVKLAQGWRACEAEARKSWLIFCKHSL